MAQLSGCVKAEAVSGGPTMVAGAKAQAVVQDFALNFTQTIEHNGEVFFPEVPESLCSLCHQISFPTCCPWATFRGQKGTQLMAHNDCLCLPCGDCADWKMSVNGDLAGRTTRPGMCDNGLMFCCCKICTCSGHAVLARFHDKEGQEYASIHKKLFACWPVVDCCLTGCTAGCLPCVDCVHVCKGHNVIRVKEQVYGPFSDISTAENDAKVGHMDMVDQLVPVFLCCAMRVPIRYSVSLNDKADPNYAAKLAGLGLLPMLYKGLATGMQCCVQLPASRPAGFSCMDMDRDVETEYMTMKEYMERRS